MLGVLGAAGRSCCSKGYECPSVPAGILGDDGWCVIELLVCSVGISSLSDAAFGVGDWI